MTRAEVVCVDGVDGVEAVVIRSRADGSLVGGERVRVSLVRRFNEFGYVPRDIVTGAMNPDRKF